MFHEPLSRCTFGARKPRDGRLFKRGDTWYAWFYDANGTRYQRTTRQTDKRAAEATLREWERRAADPTYAAAHETTLEDALRGMLRDRKLKGRAEARSTATA